MITLILFCFGTAGLTLFLDMCMEDGMIFHWYYKSIEKFYRTRIWLFKILGGCVYCFGTWVFIVLFLSEAIIIEQKTPDFIGLILGCGINYIFINIHERFLA